MNGKADIHVHTDFSDGLHEPEAIVNYAVTQTDLDVIAVTDHNTIDGARQAHSYWLQNRSEFRPIEVIVGVEVSSRDGHILGLFVQEDIPAHMSAADTVRAIHEQGGLAIAAHPFTHLLTFRDLIGIGRQIGELPLDGVEVRNSVPLELYSNWITASYNRRHRNLPALGGSDTHYITMLGQTYTRFAGTGARDFRQSLANHQVQPAGRVGGPRLALQVMQYLLQKRQLPVFLPSDARYRHVTAGLSVDVEERRDAPVAVLHCAGQLVRANADLLKKEATRLLDGGLNSLVIDLGQVDFVDSGGLGAIVAVLTRVRKTEGGLALCGLSDQVALTVRLVRLDKVLDIHQTPDDAIQALRHR